GSCVAGRRPKRRVPVLRCRTSEGGGPAGVDRVTALRRLGIAFLLAEAVGAVAWWCLLLGWPAARAPFMAAGAPDATLLAFAIPDAVLFVATAAACAVGLWVGRAWARPLLCVHAGAAGYAALYCWA